MSNSKARLSIIDFLFPILLPVLALYSHASKLDLPDSPPVVQPAPLAIKESVSPEVPIEPVKKEPVDPRELFRQQLQEAYKIKPEKAEKFSRWIIDSEMHHGIDRYTLAALIMTESSFRYHAVSSVGAVGPAQVRPGFWRDTCDGDIVKDPSANVMCGAKALSTYIKRCKGNLNCALAMYNVGPGNMKKVHFQKAKERYLNKIRIHKEAILTIQEQFSGNRQA